MENRSNFLFVCGCCAIIGAYDLHNGASRGRERERATESAEMASGIRGFASELQSREAHGFRSLL